MLKKIKLIGILIIILFVIGLGVYLKFFFSYEQRNVFQKRVENITGQNLTITVFSMDGQIVRRWNGVQKISSGVEGHNYTYFYTKDKKYVQIPNSVWYIAEEE